MSYPGREVDARDVATFCAEVLGLEDHIKDIREVHFYPNGIEVRLLATVGGKMMPFGDDPAEHVLQFSIVGEFKPRGQRELLDGGA